MVNSGCKDSCWKDMNSEWFDDHERGASWIQPSVPSMKRRMKASIPSFPVGMPHVPETQLCSNNHFPHFPHSVRPGSEGSKKRYPCKFHVGEFAQIRFRLNNDH